MVGGSALSLNASGAGSAVTLTGGTLNGTLQASGGAEATMFAGSTQYVNASSALVGFSGGTVAADVTASGASFVTLSGADVGGKLMVRGTTKVTMTAGVVGGDASLTDASRLVRVSRECSVAGMYVIRQSIHC